MKHIVRLFALAAALTASACSNLTFAVVNVPARFGSVSVTQDVAYGKADNEKMDIYRPANAAMDARLPVIVFLYGGRWEFGTKEQYRFAGTSLAEQGFIAVIPDYRKYPQVRFPAFVQDAAKAVAWTANNIQTYGGDPSDVHVAGHSAGAHIGALLATDPAYLKAEGKDRSVIRNFVGMAGPYSFVPEDKDLKEMFGPPERYPSMQATSFVDGQQPPMLLMRGAKDDTVAQYNTDRMVSAIRSHGGCVQTRLYPGLDHVRIVAELSWIGGRSSPVLNDLANFVRNGDCNEEVSDPAKTGR